jgi:hypothetical protein
MDVCRPGALRSVTRTMTSRLSVRPASTMTFLLDTYVPISRDLTTGLPVVLSLGA